MANDNQGRFRARHSIITRQPPTDADLKQRNPTNSNQPYTIEAGKRFDPQEHGISYEQAKKLAERGAISTIGDDGENEDVAATLARLGVGPAPVPSTSERDAKTAGAAPQAKGGAPAGNTSPLSTPQNRAPMQGDRPVAEVSTPATANNADAAAAQARKDAEKDRPQ